MKVAIYCRLSDEDRNKQSALDDSESIQNQKSMLITYACDKGWEIYNIYSDDDYTGSDRNRPEFNKLLNDAKDHKFDIVLCKTQSRFTRELEIVEKYIHGLFIEWNIRFISIVDNADTDVQGNKKSRQINGLINEWYLEDMSDNIKSVLTNRRKQGFHIGSFPLFGYLKDPDNKGKLLVDPEAAQIVHKVFELYAAGYGKTNIARMLNDRNIPNPTEYKRQHNCKYKIPKDKTATLWSYYTVASMLENEMYIGNMVQGKYGSISYKTKKNKPRGKENWIIVPNTHEAIIEADLWDTVKKLLNEKSRPFSNGQLGLFAYKTRCMYCGYIMRNCKSHGYHYLKCPTKHKAKDACKGSFVSYRALEKVILAELNSIANKYIDKDEINKKVYWCNDLKKKNNKLISEREELEKKLIVSSKGIKDLYTDKVKGIIDEDEFVELSRQFQNDKKRVKEQISVIDDKISSIKNAIQNSDDRMKIIEQYTNIEKLDRDIVNKLIDYIEIGKRDPETKEVPIKIHWNF